MHHENWRNSRVSFGFFNSVNFEDVAVFRFRIMDFAPEARRFNQSFLRFLDSTKLVIFYFHLHAYNVVL